MNIVITGGAGFIGSNAAKYFLDRGDSVTIFDNLSRKGSKSNLKWLSSEHKKINIIVGDVRSNSDIKSVQRNIARADAVLHLAAQVAVTTSVDNPRNDFDINALGTLNILESMRTSGSQAKCIYASTNKVYGSLSDITVREDKLRYVFVRNKYGVAESQPLDFHSPYGCSKGAADQYVHDYSRIYNLDTVVFRQSCIYGPRQFGIEDQGWVAWFMIAKMLGRPITIYGNGKQVRDILFIDDLIHAYDLVIQNKSRTMGKIYNIGGGISKSISVWGEFGPLLEKLYGQKIAVKSAEVRPGDQPIYISDIRYAKKDFGWEPKVGVREGVGLLKDWITSNRHLFR